MKKRFGTMTIAISIVFISIIAYNRITPIKQGLCKLKPVKNKYNKQFVHFFNPFVRSTHNKPETILDLPNLPNQTNTKRYFTIPLGDNLLSGMIVQESKSQIQLWLDENLNGKLTDEKPISSKLNIKIKHSKTKRFLVGPVTVTKGTQTSSQFYLCGDTEHILAFPAHYYAGKIKLNNQKYKVVLLDTNFDGKLDKTFEYPEYRRYYNSDTFGIDIARNRDWLYLSELAPLSRFVKVQNKYYDIKINQENNKNILKMNLATPEFGTLDIGQTNSHVILLSDAHSIYQTIEKKIKLPIGKYYLHSANLQIKDKHNKIWTYYKYSQSMKTKPRFEIHKGETVKLDFSGPFKIKTDVKKSGKNIISIAAYLENKAGNRYTVGRKRNGGYSKKPAIKIFNEKGDEMVNSHFKYG